VKADVLPIRGISRFRRDAKEPPAESSRLARTSLEVGRLPRQVYHLAEETNVVSIQRHGLLSASALLDLAGIHGAQRIRLEQHQRPVHITLPNGIQLRDQKPMPPQALACCLIGMDPADWYRLINSKVFFWVDLQRMDRQRRACGRRPQVVMVVDTKRLLDRYAGVASVSPINTGNARRRPAVRGLSSFVPYASWFASGWNSESVGLGTRPRPRSHRAVELTVNGAVPDIMDFVIRLHRLGPGQLYHHL
jgi:hypothetical protein